MLSLTRTKVMTIPEFLKEQNYNDRNYKENQVLENFATHIKNDKRLEKIFTFTVGSLMYCQNVLGATKGIDPLGFKLLGVFRSFAYWICIIMCIVEICKSLLQGDAKSLGKIIMKYILAFSAIYFVPWIFDIIKENFS